MRKLFIVLLFSFLVFSGFTQTIYYNTPVVNHSWLLPSLNTVATYGYPTMPQYVYPNVAQTVYGYQPYYQNYQNYQRPVSYYPSNIAYPNYYVQPVMNYPVVNYPVVQNYYYTLPVNNYYVYPNFSPYFYSMYSPYYYIFRW